jgi:uncharacterized protein (DUF2062 family)
MKKRLRYFHDKFISLKGEPKAIAMGMAIGVFVGVTPTIPFHTALLVIIAVLFKRNVMAAYLGSWVISNPITIPVFYFMQYELGRYLLGTAPADFNLASLSSLQHIVSIGWHVAVPLLLGGVIMAPFFAVPAYFITHRAVLTIRKSMNYDNSKKNSQR